MSLFGYFVDDKATVKAVPFCRALVRLAVACNDSRLRIFILDDLLPCLIQRLDNRLPCAIQSLISELNSSTNINATRNNLSSNEGDNACTSLCQELYGYMLKNNYLQTQSSAGHSKISDDDENSFKVWLKMQMEDFQTKASISKKLPNGDPWIWEFEDECQRYISIYIDMVQEVDAIDDFAERIYLDKKKLFEKLRPEFRSKYAINSYEHPYMATISSMQKRKFYSMDDVMENRKICSLVRDLIRLKKPYIKGSDSSWNVIYRAKRTVGKSAELSKYVPRSVQLLHSILLFWEPRFHPMIREALMDKLLNVVGELTTSGYLKPLLRIIEDFPPHLQPYLETKLKESNYYIAEEQIQLHEEFDEYLSSGDFDEFMDRFMYYKDDFLEYVVENKLLPSPFWALEKSLVKLSFERRAEIVSLDTEIRTYAKCVEGLLESEPLTLHVKSLISELEAEGFFDVDSKQDWEKISFAEQIAKFSSYLFPESYLPTHYAIRGLIDCRTILLEKNVNLQVAFKKVVLDVCNDLTGYLLKFWNDTRYYEHQFYAIIRDPLKQVISGASI